MKHRFCFGSCIVLAMVLALLPALADWTPPTPAPYETLAPDTAITKGSVQLGGPSPFQEGAPLLEVFFVDINRGDAIFVRLNGQTLLIDGGQSSQFGMLEKFLLKENGSLNVDSMLNTHQHDDHVDGQYTMIRKDIRPAHFFGPLATNTTDSRYKELFKSLKKRDIPYVQLFSGDLLQLGDGPAGTGATVIPSPDALPENSALLKVFRWTQKGKDPNAKSLVIHLVYGQRTLLLTADITGNAQRYYEATYGTALASDVVKAPHHGVTPITPVFLEAITPSLIIVNNKPDTTRKMNAQINYQGYSALFSGLGTIRMATDGEVWHVQQDFHGE